MRLFDVKNMTQKQIKKFLNGSAIPRPVLTLSTLNEDESINIGPFSYFNIVSSHPPLLMVGIQRPNEQMKDTTRNILRTGEAVGHIADEETIEDVNQTAASLAYGDSELKLTNFKTVNSLKVSVPGLDRFKIRYELKLNHLHVIKNHEGKITTDLLLLEIICFHIAESVYENTYIIADQLKPVSRLAGADYAKLGEQYTIERPE